MTVSICSEGIEKCGSSYRLLAVCAALLPTAGFAQDNSQDLAKKLSNPIASLISVPFQFNYDEGYGPNDGEKAYVNIQPVIPITLNDDWNLISRTILPITWQDDIAGPSGDQFGLGDISQSLFFSPSQADRKRHHLGRRPGLPVADRHRRPARRRKWGAGPTAVVLKQIGGWTVGMLANHIWSFAGDDDRADISSTFLQPFVSYTTKDAWTFTLNTESTYNWETEQWSVPINFMVAKLVVIDKQPISLSAGVRYWAESPAGGPDGWAFAPSSRSCFRRSEAGLGWCALTLRPSLSVALRNTSPTFVDAIAYELGGTYALQHRHPRACPEDLP